MLIPFIFFLQKCLVFRDDLLVSGASEMLTISHLKIWTQAHYICSYFHIN
jgi:hypothetical protein